ncbi:tripartite tricarboxylate transporter substrate binding protein [Bordetella sp. LUAb4]|uniref:Bug family tripartite tricarboxylate transporter substrate binding protein n=1 Tax=Bordetella sp. LUAb4 TaxID=2843195 RepID=UPI001E4525A3|nr:tripartite tricarboxylate transporter substrate binding protein [Bordetella sp. LUAb4]
MNNKTSRQDGGCQQLLSALLAVATAAGVVAAPMASAQTAYPDRPITLVVPAPPGGGVDTVGRVLAQQLSLQLNVSVIIENKTGAGGVVGARYVKQAKPDGYTLLLNANHQIVNPMIRPSAGYDAIKDFEAISIVGRVPLGVVVSSKAPYTSIGELFAAAKAHPGDIAWANSSTGTAGHLGTELLRSRSGADTTLINYNGGAPALTAVMGGQVTAMVEPLTSVLPHVPSGKIRVIAVTSAQRVPQLPDVPTVAESGLPGFEMNSWYAVWAPKDTPMAIRKKVADAVNAAVHSQMFRDRLEASAYQPEGSSPEQATAFEIEQAKGYQALVDKVKIKVEE